VGFAAGHPQAPLVQTNGAAQTLQLTPQWFESLFVSY
jgi:hypothetical protein